MLEKYIYGLKTNIPEYLLKDGKRYKIVSNHLGSLVMLISIHQNKEGLKESLMNAKNIQKRMVGDYK